MFKQLTLLNLVFITLAYGMNCTEFNSFKNYGGHYYTITHDKLTFADAQAYATQNGGYLAIPNDTAENSFLASIIARDAAWIGIYDPAFIQNQCNLDTSACVNNDTRFRTVKNDVLSYRNWNVGEPNNAIYNSDLKDGNALVSPLGEYWAVMGAAGKWADVGYHVKGNLEKLNFQALFEFDTMPSCATPPTDNTDIIGSIGAGGQAVCNTEVYNSDLNITVPHKTFDCQVDTEGTQYCPYMLSACGSEWDYADGHSLEATGTNDIHYDKIKIAVGKVGDNYWKSNCGEFRTTSYFNIEDISKVIDFKLKQTVFDDYIKITLNGHIVRVGPYGGNMLNIVYGDGNPYFNSKAACISGGGNVCSYQKVKYDTGVKPASCELSTSWNQTHNIDAKQWLKNGVNKVEITVIVAGAGEGYAYFEGTAISGNVQCTGENCSIDQIGDEIVHENYTYYNYLCDDGVIQDAGGDCGGDPLVDTDGDGVGDSCNSPTPPKDNCAKEKFVCQSDANRPCVKVDNKMQCSPFPCFGSGDVEDLDTPVGIDDKNNDGWTESGNCAGQLYIFNGQDNRCRSKMAFGIVNDCCKHDAFLLSLIECRDYEQILDNKKENEQCHYVGEYCSDKVLGACVQKKKTYCCFNSKLARMIVEAGREQLSNIDWGVAKNPVCRGFTPEEFEKIDFSRIDLTEFSEDIQSQINTSDIANTTQRLKDKINNMQGVSQ